MGITLKVQSPQDNVVFRNIRVPASLQNVLPLVAGQNPVEQTYKALYGKAFYPKCVVGQGYVQTVDNWKLSVNGQQVQLQKNQKITLRASSVLERITAQWTNDNTVVINPPQVRVVHQGKTVTVEVNNTPNGSQCGLCGDYNMDKGTDVLSSKGCIMSSVKLAAHTYRSKSEQCRPISEKTL